MSTCKLGKYFASQGYQSAAFSFAQTGHAPPDSVRLFHAKEAGGVRSNPNLAELARALVDFNPHVVINHMPYEAAIGDVLAQPGRSYVLLGCLRNTLFSVKGDIPSFIKNSTPRIAWPLLLTRSGQEIMLALHKRRHASQLRRILATYDRFVMFGPPNLEELRYFVPEFSGGQIALIPNSIPKVSSILPDKEKRILWLGRVARSQKRVDLLVEIWQRVSALLPDWELDMVGDGPDLDWLKSRVQSLGLDGISFHGRQVPDAYFARSSVFLMTSSFEGFPNTLVEAQSYGAVPVIFDSYPVASWIVQDGVNGLLVEPFDLEAMSTRIVELVQSPRLPEMGQASLDSARRFLIDNVGRHWKDLFAQELAKRPGSTDWCDRGVT